MPRAPTSCPTASSRAIVVASVIAVVAVLATAPPTQASTGWRWPVRGAVISPFHTGSDPFAAGQHRGIDIAAPAGTPVLSACSGQVSFAGYAGSSGRTVSIRCGGLTATYLHLGSVAVRRGQELVAGGGLGSVGTSGRARASSPHLHLGARWTDRRWGYVDPLSLLGDPPPIAGPPLLPATRRAPGPLGPAPRRLAPRVVAMPRTMPVVIPRASGARATQRALAPPIRVPWPAWAGLGLAAAALPTGLVRRGRCLRAARGLRRLDAEPQ